jgi:hypothetical protein
MNKSDEPFVEVSSTESLIQAYIFGLYRLIVKRFIRRAFYAADFINAPLSAILSHSHH